MELQVHFVLRESKRGMRREMWKEEGCVKLNVIQHVHYHGVQPHGARGTLLTRRGHRTASSWSPKRCCSASRSTD
jgi:hypothetical protein